MEDNNQNSRRRKTIVAVIAVASVAVVLFLCIFSLYHLPERDPVETPELAENATVAEMPSQDFAETDDIMGSTPEEVSGMLGELEMQYENAKLNGQPYEAQQDGLRLALAYWKAGQSQQAKDLVASLIQNYGYDSTFVAKCDQMLHTFTSSAQ